jgi:L-asparaginase II
MTSGPFPRVPDRPSGRCSRLRLEVLVRRGSIVESRHGVQAVVCDAAGTLRAATAHPELVTTFRSAAKPFQLLPLVERGHAERFGLDDEHLAVMAASHTGSAYHVGLVTDILNRLGLDDRALACGFHEPLDPDSRRLLRADPGRESPLFNNCSGKHAGMLCLARSEGWPIEGYWQASHPVQRLMRDTIADVCGLASEELEVAIDGCSVSVFGVPLARMARAYARLASASEDAADARGRALARIRRAMQRYPRATGGEGRLSTRLMELAGPSLVAKGGAEGLECVGCPDLGLGVALKCEDGNERALGPALLALLGHLDLVDASLVARLGDGSRPVLRNHAGLEVGAIEAAVLELEPAAG